jgi:hypothetical protein
VTKEEGKMFKGMVAFIALCFTVSLAADQNPPAFYFGGHRLSVGMSKADADMVVVSSQHERMSNADAEILILTLPNGRSIEMQIATLDTPDKMTGKRDSVTLDEVLQ